MIITTRNEYENSFPLNDNEFLIVFVKCVSINENTYNFKFKNSERSSDMCLTKSDLRSFIIERNKCYVIKFSWRDTLDPATFCVKVLSNVSDGVILDLDCYK